MLTLDAESPNFSHHLHYYKCTHEILITLLMLLFINLVVSFGCYVHSSDVAPDPEADIAGLLQLAGKTWKEFTKSSSISVVSKSMMIMV